MEKKPRVRTWEPLSGAGTCYVCDPTQVFLPRALHLESFYTHDISISVYRYTRHTQTLGQFFQPYLRKRVSAATSNLVPPVQPPFWIKPILMVKNHTVYTALVLYYRRLHYVKSYYTMLYWSLSRTGSSYQPCDAQRMPSGSLRQG